MIYSAYKLNKQGGNIQPWHTPFPILNQPLVPCPILTVASCPAYRFLRRQVRWSGIPNSLRILQFVVIHTDKGFSVVNEVEVDVFLEFPCFFYHPVYVCNLISAFSVFPKSSLYIWKFSVHVQLKHEEVKWSEVAQSCPTLCNPVDCSLPGSSFHGIFQARVNFLILMLGMVIVATS